MRPLPLVSVITPAYNAGPFLAETISSVLLQTFENLELLIVDDGSTDDTLEQALRWARTDARIRVVANPHVGISHARNTAMAQARGEFFALLDSDDVWLPTYLAEQMAIFTESPQAGVVAGNAFNLGGRCDGQPFNKMGPARTISLLDMIEQERAVCVMSVFRRAVYERIGAFDEQLDRNEDYDFWLRAAHAGFLFVENTTPLGRYRRRPGSVSTDTMKMLNGIIRVLWKIRALCADSRQHVATIDRQLARFESERLYLNAKASLLQRDFSTAAEHFESLRWMRGDLVAHALAQFSRHVPGMLLWAYRTRSTLRAAARRPVADA
jgi:glycosyltransferase involved in cell wall biosynthesis